MATHRNGMLGVVRDAVDADAVAMAPHLREADRLEIVAASGYEDSAEALREALNVSVIAKAWDIDGKVACLFGLSGSMFSETGHPWFLSTAMVQKHRIAFARQCRSHLRDMLALFPVLENYVDARYGCSVRWLEWLGFRLEEPKPYGPYGLLFRRFTMKMEH